MNSVGIISLMAFFTAFMLTLSYHSSYLLDAVILLEKQKSYFYAAEGLLAHGVAYYKQHHETVSLPCTIYQKVDDLEGSLFGKIILSKQESEYDQSHLEIRVELYAHKAMEHQVARHTYLIACGKDDASMHVQEWHAH